MYYSGRIFTYKLDWTTVMVGAPSMLEISTSPASACASSSTSVATGSSAARAAASSILPSTVGAYGSTTVVDRCVNCDTSSSTVGAGLRLLSAGSPIVSQSSSSPWSTGSKGGISCEQRNFVVSVHNVARPPRRRRQTSLQTSWRILDERNIG
jgi:hypothetical protein